MAQRLSATDGALRGSPRLRRVNAATGRVAGLVIKYCARTIRRSVSLGKQMFRAMGSLKFAVMVLTVIQAHGIVVQRMFVAFVLASHGELLY